MAWIEKVVRLFAAIDLLQLVFESKALQELEGVDQVGGVLGSRTPTAAAKRRRSRVPRAWDRLIVAENRAIVVMISVPPALIPRVPLCSPELSMTKSRMNPVGGRRDVATRCRCV